jgi:hypothetical protein
LGLVGCLVARVAVELRLFGLLFRAIRLFATQADVAMEAKLELPCIVFEELVDDRAFARAGGLEEGHLALGLESDDFTKVGSGDGGFAHDVGVERWRSNRS